MTTATVEIYTTKTCGYCYAAKSLLKKRGVRYQEIDLTFDRARRDELGRRAAGRSSVPQIFIDGRSIGGYAELKALARSGELEDLLGGSEGFPPKPGASESGVSM